jgi:hypothetical protein
MLASSGIPTGEARVENTTKQIKKKGMLVTNRLTISRVPA